ILNNTLKLFTDMTEKSISVFRRPSNKKFKIPTNTTLKSICEKFIRKEQEKYYRLSQKVGDKAFRKFLKNCKNVEIGYLETGYLESSFNKQMQDHKKLNRLAKDFIDT
ncbi:12949_t:CDS:2, partial [Dentiscutata heterogama]